MKKLKWFVVVFFVLMLSTYNINTGYIPTPVKKPAKTESFAGEVKVEFYADGLKVMRAYNQFAIAVNDFILKVQFVKDWPVMQPESARFFRTLMALKKTKVMSGCKFYEIVAETVRMTNAVARKFSNLSPYAKNVTESGERLISTLKLLL